MSQGPPAVRAAGVVPWRRHQGRLQVAMVHRARYDDWSWPKGKLDPGENWPVAAARETLEETGLIVRLGLPLPSSHYSLERHDGSVPKQVRYWSGQVIGGAGVLEHEIDDVAWLEPADAPRLLTHDRDSEQLQAVVGAEADDTLDVWPLAVVRHASSLSRRRWTGDDPLRPLSRKGRSQALALADLLTAYRITRALSSDSVRCVDTLGPYSERTGLPVTGERGLSEEDHQADPATSLRHLDRLLSRPEPAVLCTHRPVLPGLLEQLAARTPGPEVRQVLRETAERGLAKGETLVCQLTGAGHDARVVSVERHRPR